MMMFGITYLFSDYSGKNLIGRIVIILTSVLTVSLNFIAFL